MFLLRILVLVLGLIISSVGSVFADNWSPQSLVVFGAGSPDYGRSYQLYKIPVSPPYWQHRFSNGPVYDEILAHKMGLIQDPQLHPNYWKKNKKFLSYAYIGATATDKYIFDSKYMMNFNGEINQYLSKAHSSGADSLVIIDADLAKNDMMSDECRDHTLTCVNDVLAAFKAGMTKLCVRAKITHFIVVTPTGSRDSPFAVMLYDQSVRDKLSLFRDDLVRSVNGLAQQMQSQCHGIDIDIFPLLQYESKWFKWQSSYVIPTPIPCYNNLKGSALVYNQQIGPVCDDPNKHFYFDTIFMSNSASHLLANALYNEITTRKWKTPSIWQKMHNFLGVFKD